MHTGSRAVTITYPGTLCLTNYMGVSVQGIRKHVWCTGREANCQVIESILSEVPAFLILEWIRIGGNTLLKKAWKTEKGATL